MPFLLSFLNGLLQLQLVLDVMKGNLFVSAVCYADDIVLLAPCVFALRILPKFFFCTYSWSQV